MCAGALVLARISRLVFGAWDPKAGAAGSLFNIPKDPRLNHRMEVVSGILEEECSEILKAFFRERRAQTKNK
jgi:tRNA(adenine34) deaminase